MAKATRTEKKLIAVRVRPDLWGRVLAQVERLHLTQQEMAEQAFSTWLAGAERAVLELASVHAEPMEFQP